MDKLKQLRTTFQKKVVFSCFLHDTYMIKLIVLNYAKANSQASCLKLYL